LVTGEKNARPYCCKTGRIVFLKKNRDCASFRRGKKKKEGGNTCSQRKRGENGIFVLKKRVRGTEVKKKGCTLRRGEKNCLRKKSGGEK